MSPHEEEPTTVFELVGGEPFFAALTARFYASVAEDAILAELHPADLGPSEMRTRLFLIQYWGGPATYSQQRGHPRLRMRHGHVRIDQAARDAWVEAMLAALTETVEEYGVHQLVHTAMVDYFTFAADAMINVRSRE